ncbi:MAG TPA: oligosaccharide flippase family protein [Verrucomicrobiae bacterium]
MSRVRRFTHSLLSGYAQLGVNTLFTLITVRLALHYLSTDEYGLSMPVATIAGYVALLDLGMSGAAARILIDYKDHQKPEEYGGIIKTSALVGLAQAALIVVVGIGLAFVLGPLERISPPLRGKFFWLVIGQCCVTAGMFATRIVSLILTANQRFDVGNYSGSAGLAANGAVVWWGFAHGVGVFSLIWGQAAGVLTILILCVIYCGKLKLLPREGQWGEASWEKFRELFAFGQDIFLYMLGAQFVNFSQVLLLTPLIGLEASVIWTVCTRAFAIPVQVIGRVFDYSTSALAEMMVRGERAQLLKRFRDVTILSINLAVAAGAIFAVTNAPFVHIWTKGEIHWRVINDVLLAFWLIITVTVKLHTGLVGQTKNLHGLRYLYFVEGIAFIGVTILFHGYGGITVMLLTSIVCSLCCTTPYGLWRSRDYFHLTWKQLAAWHKSTFLLAATVAPVAAAVWLFTRNLPALEQLVLRGGVVGLWTALMFLRHGLASSVRADACRQAPNWAKPLLTRMGAAHPET